MNSPIYLIESDNRHVLAETFMRFQEYYESPVFAGQHFSIEEFKAWYAQEYGSFSYAHDWSGFNIPSWVLQPFKKGDFDPLTEKEKRLVNYFKNKRDNGYVIGVNSKDDFFADTVKHEFTHGAFSVNKDYRGDVTELLKSKNLKTVKKALREMGYGSNVITDEANAYMLTEPQTMEKEISLTEGRKVRDALDEIFIKYFKFSMVKTPVSVIMRKISQISI